MIQRFYNWLIRQGRLLVPGSAKKLRYLKHDVINYVKYNFAKEHTGEDSWALKDFQVYPVGKNIETFYQQNALIDEKHRTIDKKTPLCSIGGCFGEHFRFFFVDNGYHYLITEPNITYSCAWGRQYTTANLRQVFDYTFGEFKVESRLYETKIGYMGKGGIIDPYRETFYGDFEEGYADLEKHRHASREALTKCDAMVIIVGQSEAWVNRDDESVFIHRPPADIMERRHFEFRQFGVADNIKNLESIVAYLREFNPKCRIILTVTPVPSYATFVDRNIIDWSLLNRSVMIVAVHELAEKYREFVSYFPAYEMVMMIARNPLIYDNRHARLQAIDSVMEQFEHFYCRK